MEIVTKWVNGDKPHSRGGLGSSVLWISDSPFLEEIISHCFSKKFMIRRFGATDLIQHLRAYQVKVAVHSYDDYLMCRVFSSSVNGLALEWFYSLSSRSLRSFKEISDAFFNQYTLRQEFKKNNNHLLTIKMKSGETFKHYIDYFQNHMVIVYNCSDDVAVATFIAGLQTDHSFYKHLVKHTTKMHDI